MVEKMEVILAKFAPLELARSISFETLREWFDSISLEKLLPFFGVCMVLIVADISLEVSCARAVFLLGTLFGGFIKLLVVLCRTPEADIRRIARRSLEASTSEYY